MCRTATGAHNGTPRLRLGTRFNISYEDVGNKTAGTAPHNSNLRKNSGFNHDWLATDQSIAKQLIKGARAKSIDFLHSISKMHARYS